MLQGTTTTAGARRAAAGPSSLDSWRLRRPEPPALSEVGVTSLADQHAIDGDLGPQGKRPVQSNKRRWLVTGFIHGEAHWRHYALEQRSGVRRRIRTLHVHYAAERSRGLRRRVAVDPPHGLEAAKEQRRYVAVWWSARRRRLSAPYVRLLSPGNTCAGSVSLT